MKKKYILLALSCVSFCFLGILTGCGKKDAKTVEAQPEVSVALPLTDSIILTQTYPATLSASQSADIVGLVNGTLQKILFEEGDYVTAGQPLFIIDPSTYRDQVSEAQAALETASAVHEYSQRQNEAMQKALEADAVSRLDVIQAESNLKQSAASIKRAKAELAAANTKLGYCTVRAPFSGYVTKATVSEGAYISGESAPVKLATIYANQTIYANFSISTDKYILIRDTSSGKDLDLDHIPVLFGDSVVGKYYGKLDYTAPNVSTSTGTVNLRLIIDNSKGELRDGMFATVRLPYTVEPHALLVKDASLSTDQLGKYLYTVNDSDKVIYTPVEVGGLYQDTLRVVTKGLTPNDRYVTTALLKVRDGMKVKPIR